MLPLQRKVVKILFDVVGRFQFAALIGDDVSVLHNAEKNALCADAVIPGELFEATDAATELGNLAVTHREHNMVAKDMLYGLPSPRVFFCDLRRDALVYSVYYVLHFHRLHILHFGLIFDNKLLSLSSIRVCGLKAPLVSLRVRGILATPVSVLWRYEVARDNLVAMYGIEELSHFR